MLHIILLGFQISKGVGDSWQLYLNERVKSTGFCNGRRTSNMTAYLVSSAMSLIQMST